MIVNAYIQSGRMVASAYTKPAMREKRAVLLWHDTRDCGGVYDLLQSWMRAVCLEQGPTACVSFRIEPPPLISDNG
jgi:hypothetical protein